MKLKNLSCNKTQKLEMGPNSIQSFSNSNCDKIPQLKLGQNSISDKKKTISDNSLLLRTT